jgi:hypothetical protein
MKAIGKLYPWVEDEYSTSVPAQELDPQEWAYKPDGWPASRPESIAHRLRELAEIRRAEIEMGG